MTDLFGRSKLVRALIDPGAQTTIIASSAIDGFQVERRQRNRPIRISGLNPQVDYVTDSEVLLVLRDKTNNEQTIEITSIVMECKGWDYKPPFPVTQWLKNTAPCLSDPAALLTENKPLGFHIILNVTCAIQVLDPMPTRRFSNLEIRGSMFGYVIAGENPPETSKLPIDQPEVESAGTYAGILFNKSKARKRKQKELGELSPRSQKETSDRLTSDHDATDLTTPEVNNCELETLDAELSREIKDMIELLRYNYFGDNTNIEELQQDVADLESSFQRAPDGRLWVVLPKNPRCQNPLSKNLNLNRARVNGTKARCQRDPAFYKGYKESFDTWKQLGVILPVTETELTRVNNWTELPYHGVLRKGDGQFVTTKFRLVLDGSAKEQDHASVNEFLRIGSNVLPKIIKVITKFRQSPYFTLADIEKAFLQIGLLSPDDHLFIFRAIVQDQQGEWHEELYRFARMPWGINCAPYVLNVAVRYLYTEYCKQMGNSTKLCEIFKKLAETTYVDDILALSSTFQELKEMSTAMITALESGKMHVTKLRTFPPSFVPEILEGSTPTLEPYKVLGLRFFPETNEVSVCCDKLPELLDVELFTKKKAAGVGARVHDTQGLVEPTTLRAKLLFQRTNEQYNKTTDWSTVLNRTLIQEWKELIKDLIQVDQLRFQRCLTINKSNKRLLILFTDASAIAIGACLYEVEIQSDGTRISVLGRAQNQVVPLKRQQSLKLEREKQQKSALRINRLELQAIELGVKLAKSYVEDSDSEFETIYGFTDSEVSLHWIYSEQIHHTEYVQKRVNKALEVIPKYQWLHVKGTENPADILSRGCTVDELRENSLWKFGPKWVTNDPSTWTVFKERTPEILVLTNTQKQETLTQISRSKTWKELVLYQLSEMRILNNDATYEEAEFQVIKSTQIQEIPDLYLYLSGKKSAAMLPESQRNMIDELGLFLGENGIIWSRSRNAIFKHLNKDGILPIDKDLVFFPNTGSEAKLLLQWIHEYETGHGAPNVALALLRTKFWMPKARGLFKTIRRKCKVCQLLQAVNMKQIEAPLPKERYFPTTQTQQKPFDCCGIDYVGPFFPFRSKEPVKRTRQAVETHEVQRNLLVFTCALTRAVSIESCPTTGFEDFVSAFECFCSRFSKPRVIYSDNAQTFHQSSRLLIVFDTETSNQLRKNFPEITWKFNASRAPWWGGFYERMMAMVKLHLAIQFKEKVFKNELSFNSSVAIIQNIINSRPLVQASDNDRSDATFITPNHFIKPNYETEVFRSFHFDLDKLQARSLDSREMKQRLQSLRDFHQQLWDDFSIRYLSELRKFHANRTPDSTESVSKLKVGDIVLVQPENVFKKSRHFKLEWPKAIIKEIPVGPDTRYRRIVIETIPHGVRLERPVQKLYRLEVDERDSSNN